MDTASFYLPAGESLFPPSLLWFSVAGRCPEHGTAGKPGAVAGVDRGGGGGPSAVAVLWLGVGCPSRHKGNT